MKMNGSRRPKALAALLLAVFSLGAGGCDKLKSRQLIRQGHAYFKENLVEDALKKYQEAQTLDPDEPRLDKFIAMCNMAMYNPGSKHAKDQQVLDEAVNRFQKYLKVHPEDDKASKYLVSTYLSASKYDEAIDYFKQWLTRNASDTQAVQTVAMLYAKKGDFENSMEWQRKRAQMEPNNAEVFYTMGVTAWQKSYDTVPDALAPEARKAILDDGMKNLNRANELRPDYFEAMFYINLMYREYAKLESDPAKKQQLNELATEWQKKGLEARKRVQQRQQQEAAQKNPLEAM